MIYSCNHVVELSQRQCCQNRIKSVYLSNLYCSQSILELFYKQYVEPIWLMRKQLSKWQYEVTYYIIQSHCVAAFTAGNCCHDAENWNIQCTFIFLWLWFIEIVENSLIIYIISLLLYILEVIRVIFNAVVTEKKFMLK